MRSPAIVKAEAVCLQMKGEGDKALVKPELSNFVRDWEDYGKVDVSQEEKLIEVYAGVKMAKNYRVDLEKLLQDAGEDVEKIRELSRPQLYAPSYLYTDFNYIGIGCIAIIIDPDAKPIYETKANLREKIFSLESLPQDGKTLVVLTDYDNPKKRATYEICFLDTETREKVILSRPIVNLTKPNSVTIRVGQGIVTVAGSRRGGGIRIVPQLDAISLYTTYHTRISMISADGKRVVPGAKDFTNRKAFRNRPLTEMDKETNR